MNKMKKVISSFSVLALVLSLCSVFPAVSSAATAANNTIFGPNVYVFDPSMSTSDIEGAANAVFNSQETSQFGNQRFALMFKPGTYNVNIKAGFYTQIAGLGQNPDDVTITGGANVDAKWWGGNATLNFWRSFENFAINPSSGETKFAVAQAAPMRRMHIKGNLNLFDFDQWWNAGWASGGYIADSIIDKTIVPASQQQFFSRNNQYATWTNGLWNMVFVGDSNPPQGTFPEQPYTVVDQTPVMREKPYLYIDNAGQYKVFVPNASSNTKGASWTNGSTPGQSISIDQFYIAQPNTATAASINAALSQGKNVIFTPGIYHLNDTIRVNNANTVILGLGMATIMPDNGQVGMSVADVDGVKVAGLLFDAGPKKSSNLLEVGPKGSALNHAANPTSLHDLFFRVGGDILGLAETVVTINSNNVIGDHFWVWRADHGASVSWETASTNGLIVNGNDVTMYGLFNEHHSGYQTLWNGNGGRTYFYQSEIPYDPPSQAAWMSSNGTVNGYASYKVADNVTSHEAWGLGVYSFFRDAAVKLNSAIEVPDVQGIKIHHATSIWLAGMAGSEITHIVNNLGGKVTANDPADAMRQTLTEFIGSGAADTQAPTAPGNLTAAASSSSQINLSWNASTDNKGVAGYDVYRNGTLVGSSASTTYSDTGLTASTAYSYTVKAKDGAGNASAASNTASATTQAGAVSGTLLDRTGWTASSTPVSGDSPANMLDGSLATRWSAGTAMAPGQSVTIDMKAAKNITKVVMDSTGSDNDYARGYEVYVSADGSNWGSAAASGTGAGAVITANVSAQNVRYIKVVQTGTVSNWWSISELNVYSSNGTGGGDMQAPSVPANVTATAVSSSQINLTWAASTDNVGVSGYDVYRNGSVVGSATATSYSDTGLTASTAYSYTVKAKDAAGNASAASAAVSATTQASGGNNGGSTGAALDRTGWTVTSMPTSGDGAANMIDGSMATRWSAGTAMAPGQAFVIDMKAVKGFNKIVMDSTGSDNDYARGYEVYVSNDGLNWGTPIASGTGTGAVVTASFATQNAKYIKVVQTGTASSWWSIREVNVYGASGGTSDPGTGGGSTGTAYDRTGWTATSNPVSGDPASNLLDGSMATRWSAGTAMVAGQSIIVDMKAAKSVSKVVMDSTGSDNDYARGYEVYVSNDGTNWGAAVTSGTGNGPVVTASFATQNARYIKIVQTGSASSWWSVRELNVFN
ncbi:coagulation factor 5/8 type domain protein [Paenibacillus curdlanolyticus YK9]|uniref:Coagulation factor 5/8 type domain protein n=1 Tax=Paenibacillus curdlanolyticus YK9 TaxID=717606 RepID=E0ICS6_9BACL|nr:discoidin domain-containing protein [Paenibacillus curdlanolyticus]EFM09962.1 coagulation factor 5/8 type domain protein [Paenibacillus curdlanolyticus YK9]